MRTAQLDDPGMDADRGPARRLRRNGVGQHHPQAVLDLVQYGTDLRAEDETIAGQRCRRQARRLLSDTGKLLELPVHLRVGAVGAGGENDALAGPDGFARSHHDAGHSLVLDREAFHMLIGQYSNAAIAQHLEEMTDQAQPLAAHVLPLALADELLVPAR